MRRAAFPLALQGLALCALAALAANGLGVGAESAPRELLTLRKTSLTTLAVWGLWWPGMIALALVAGRAWCTVCPLELVHRLAHAAARRLGLRGAPLRRSWRAGWLAVAAYLLLQLLVAGASIHRVPHATGLVLLSLAAAAAACGIAFREPRSFCAALCPAGPLLSVYGRTAPLQLDVRDPAACEACVERPCVSAATRGRLDGRGCPSLARPFEREAGDACVLCFQCAKTCAPGNVGWGVLERPAAELRSRLLSPAATAFALVASGFVMHEIAGELKPVDALFHAPAALLARLVPALRFEWLEAGWFLVGFPAALWSIVVLAARAARHPAPLGTTLREAATAAAPVIALAHLAKAAAKVGGWGGYLPLALREPRGTATAAEILSGVRTAPRPLFAVSTVGAALALLLLWVAVRAAQRMARDRGTAGAAARAGLGVALAVYGAVLVAWAVG